jgi:hypothetical protein
MKSRAKCAMKKTISPVLMLEFNADFQETSSGDNYADFQSNLHGLNKAEASAAVSTNEENSENTLGEEKSIQFSL